MPLLIASVIACQQTLEEGAVLAEPPILDALLNAGANPMAAWSKGSQHTALVEAVQGGDTVAVARLIAADADLVVLWSAGEDADIVGKTPRLLAVEGGDGCGLQPSSVKLEGRWCLVQMNYANYRHGSSAPWGSDEAYNKPYLGLSGDGTYQRKELDGSQTSGKWTKNHQGIFLSDDDLDDTFEAELAAGGLALVCSLSDEQTGWRGPATWTHLPERCLHGLPREGALVDWDEVS